MIVRTTPDAAFTTFTDGLQTWWPVEYTWSGTRLVRIGFEPHLDGKCFEIGPHEFRCDWGRIVAWEPPRRLAFLWQIGPHREPVPDPDRASAVTVSFGRDDAGTRVEVWHGDFERHGHDARAYRDALAAPEGWPFMLDRFATAVDRGAG